MISLTIRQCGGSENAPQEKGGGLLSHKNKKSLIRQVQEKLYGMMRPGDSRHRDKQIPGTTSQKIYSYNTMSAYLQQCCNFVTFAKTEFQVKTLDACRPYVNAFLQKEIGSGKSSYTIKLAASALGKLYQCSTKEFLQTPSRSREAITRSRGKAKRDAHFSEKNHGQLVNFCCCTGLRRHELNALTGDCLRQDSDGNFIIHVERGKGGRSRDVTVTGTASEVQNVVTLCEKAGTGKVFEKIPNGADVHHYRAVFASRVYEKFARPIFSLQSSERYCCRGAKAGTVYDRSALLEASKQLGHNRISVVASHYLYSMEE